MNSGGEPAAAAVDEKWLGKRLQIARRAAGLTQQGLCQKAGLSYSTLAKIERGAIKAPSIFTVQTIATALDVSLDELIGNPKSSAHGRQQSKSGVRFVYFDINGCLVRFYHAAFTRLAEASGQPADVVEMAFWHYNDQICRGEMSMADFNAKLAKQLAMPELKWEDYYLAAVEPIHEMAELADWVSQRYGIGLLTNVMPGIVSSLRQRGLIPDLNYDAVIDSSEVHAIKPEAKIYEVATERAGCPPDQILLVDDSRANVMAAAQLGWHVLWFDDEHASQSATRIRQTLEPATNDALNSTTPQPQSAYNRP